MDPKYLSKLLVDDYVMKILMASYSRPMSTQEMSFEFGIPIAVCYRKVRELMAAGLLMKERKILTDQGKWVQLFRSKLKGAYVFLENGSLRVRVELSDEIEPTMDRSVPVINSPQEVTP
ncbi:transcriptional regulator [Thermoplasmatales archaeon ex4484_6]|nr:MAG: transcriptional regulator [Thermoplasmatales archaeon ex4484_6]RLF65647.1 MAG: ArsR family transcriptional regulator [Thermoplasmata archaeon]